MEAEGSLPCLQEPSTATYPTPEPDESKLVCLKFPHQTLPFFLLPSTFDIPRPSYPASDFSVLQYIYGTTWCSYTLDDLGSKSDTGGSVLATPPRPARGTTSPHILLLSPFWAEPTGVLTAHFFRGIELRTNGSLLPRAYTPYTSMALCFGKEELFFDFFFSRMFVWRDYEKILQ